MITKKFTTTAELNDMIARFNESGGTAFRLEGTYGQFDLWAKLKEGGESRVESGSKNDIKNALIKNRFNPKYVVKTASVSASKKTSGYRGSERKFENRHDYADYLMEIFGAENLLDQLVMAMGDSEAFKNFDYIAQMNDLTFEDEGDSVDASKKTATENPSFSHEDSSVDSWALDQMMPKKEQDEVDEEAGNKKTAEYNGYKNYETWAVSLWLDNDEGSQLMMREWAQEAKAAAGEDDNTKEGIWTEDETAKFRLADQIKEFTEDQNPLNDAATVYTDLLNAAISEVDFVEIAENMLSEFAVNPMYEDKTAGKEVSAAPRKKKPAAPAAPAEPETVSFDEEGVKKEMASALGVSEDDVTVDAVHGTVSNGLKVVAEGTEYEVMESESAAEAAAIAQVKEDLENEPELFTESRLEGFIDKDDMAGTLASDDWEGYIEMDRDLDGKELNEELGVDTYEEGTTYAHSAAWDEWKTPEDWQAQYKDIIMDDFELYFPKKEWLKHIDIDEAAADAVSTDGWAHFLSRYDGNYETTPAGFVYWRE